MSVVTQRQVLFLCKPRDWERFCSNLFSQGVLLTPKPVCDRESGQRAYAPVWNKEGLSYRWKLRCSFHRGRWGSVVEGQVLGNMLGMNPAEQPALRDPDREREEWLTKLRPLLPTKHWDGPVQWATSACLELAQEPSRKLPLVYTGRTLSVSNLVSSHCRFLRTEVT